MQSLEFILKMYFDLLHDIKSLFSNKLFTLNGKRVKLYRSGRNTVKT